MSATLLLLVGLLTAQAPTDTSKLDAKIHFDKAETHYRLGRFEEALAEYTAAYELFPEPAFLFNLGQCHRNLQRWERAVFFFKTYLQDRPDAPDRPRVESLIAELEAKQAPPPAPPTQAPGGDEATVEPTPSLVEPAPPLAAEDDSVLGQWWLWAIVGTVVVGATVAIVVASQGGSGLPDDLPSGASVLDFRDR